jgi:hypothetical protein
MLRVENQLISLCLTVSDVVWVSYPLSLPFTFINEPETAELTSTTERDVDRGFFNLQEHLSHNYRAL